MSNLTINNRKTIDSIIKECFWEYQFKADDLLKIALGDNEREQQFLYGIIFENSTNTIKALRIFPKKTLFRLIKSQNSQTFKHRFLERRLKIIKYHFLKEKVSIPGLEWQIPK